MPNFDRQLPGQTDSAGSKRSRRSAGAWVAAAIIVAVALIGVALFLSNSLAPNYSVQAEQRAEPARSPGEIVKSPASVSPAPPASAAKP